MKTRRHIYETLIPIDNANFQSIEHWDAIYMLPFL